MAVMNVSITGKDRGASGVVKRVEGAVNSVTKAQQDASARAREMAKSIQSTGRATSGLNSLQKATKSVESALKSAQRTAVKGIKVAAELTGADKLKADLSAIQRARDDLDGSSATVNVGERGSIATIAKMKRIEAARHDASGDVHITTKKSLGAVRSLGGGLLTLTQRFTAFSDLAQEFSVEGILVGLGAAIPLMLGAAGRAVQLGTALGAGVAGGAAIGGTAIYGMVGALKIYTKVIGSAISASREAYTATHEHAMQQLEDQRNTILNTQASKKFNAQINKSIIAGTRLQAAVGSKVFPLFGRELQSWTGLLGKFQGRITNTAGMVAKQAAGFSRWFRTADQGRLLGNTLGFIDRSAIAGSRTLSNLGKGGVRIFQALITPASRLQHYIVQLTQNFDKWSASAKGTKQIATFVGFLERRMYQLINITMSAGHGIFNVFAAIDKATNIENTLNPIVFGLDDFVKATDEGSKGAQKITEFMRKMNAPLAAVGSLALDVGKRVLEMGYEIAKAGTENGGKSNLTKLVESLHKGIVPVLGVIEHSFIALSPALTKLIPQVGQFLGTFMGSTGSLVTFINTMTQMLKFINGLPGPIKRAAVEFLGFKTVLSALGMGGPGVGTVLLMSKLGSGLVGLPSAAKSASAAVGGFSGVLTGLKAAGSFLIFTPWGAVLAAIAIAAIVIYKNWSKIRPVLDPVIAALGRLWQMAKTAFGKLKSIAMQGWNAFTGFVRGQAQKFMGWWRGVWHQITQLGSGGLGKGAKTAFMAYFGVIKRVFTAVVNFIRKNSGTIKTIVKAAWSNVKLVVGTAVKLIGNVIKLGLQVINGNWRGAWKTLGRIVKLVWHLITGLVKNEIKIVSGIIKLGWNAIKGVTKSAWNLIKRAVVGAWNLIKRVVSGAANGVKNVVVGVWNGIKKVTGSVWNGIKHVLSAVWNWIKHAASTLWNNEKRGWSAVWNAIKKVTSSVWNGIKHALDSAWKAISGAAKAFWNAEKKGWTAIWNAVKKITTTVWNAIKSAVEKVWNAMKSTATSVGNAIKSVVTKTWNAIKSATSSTWDAIKSAMSSKIEEAKNKVTSTVTGLKNALGDLWDQIKSKGADAWNSLKNNVVDATSSLVSKVKGYWTGFVNFVNKILSAVHLPTIKAGIGGSGNVHASKNAKGGVHGFAKGGVVEKYAKGGLARPNEPRVHVWGEGAYPEGFITTDPKYRRENIGYLKAIAGKLGQVVVPGSAAGTGGDFGGRPRAKEVIKRGGATSFAQGGLSTNQVAEYKKRGDELLGKPYKYGNIGTYAGPDGASCSGLWAHIIYNRSGNQSYGTYSFNRGTPGMKPGGGQVEVGVTLHGAGGHDGTHMAGDIDGTSYESTIGPGVHHGAKAGNFPKIWHLGSAKAAEKGSGSGFGFSVPNPLQALFDRMWDSLIQKRVDAITNELKQGFILKQAAGNVISNATSAIHDWIDNKIPDTIGGGGSGGGPTGDSPKGLTISDAVTQGGWPDKLHNTAVGVAWEESGGNVMSNATAPYRGLFAMGKGAFQDVGMSFNRWRDPIYNSTAAAKLQAQQGWSPWQAYPPSSSSMHRGNTKITGYARGGIPGMFGGQSTGLLDRATARAFHIVADTLKRLADHGGAGGINIARQPNGGVVNRITALAGENGPESVVPLGNKTPEGMRALRIAMRKYGLARGGVPLEGWDLVHHKGRLGFHGNAAGETIKAARWAWAHTGMKFVHGRDVNAVWRNGKATATTSSSGLLRADKWVKGSAVQKPVLGHEVGHALRLAHDRNGLMTPVVRAGSHPSTEERRKVKQLFGVTQHNRHHRHGGSSQNVPHKSHEFKPSKHHKSGGGSGGSGGSGGGGHKHHKKGLPGHWTNAKMERFGVFEANDYSGNNLLPSRTPQHGGGSGGGGTVHEGDININIGDIKGDIDVDALINRIMREVNQSLDERDRNRRRNRRGLRGSATSGIS